MLRASTAALALVAAPALLFAQRGGADRPRQTNANFDQMAAESRPAVQLTKGDLEDISPIHLLLDKRKQLKLTDDQQKQLKDLEARLKEKNQSLFKSVDSLRQALRTRPGTAAEEEQPRLVLAREAFQGVVKIIRENYDASARDAMPLLDDTQKATATELLQKQAKDAEEMLREKMGPGGMGGGGRRGRP